MMLAFLLVGQSLMDLSTAERFRRDRASEELALSAVQQFKSEAARVRNQPGYWLARFRRPVFPDGGQRLGGTVEVTFDAERAYHSVDNSDSEKPAVGYFDRGTGKKSVPPFGASLVMKVNAGGAPVYYEALLQRTWPYVLATGSRIHLNQQLGCPPSRISGHVLMLPDSGPALPIVLPQTLFELAARTYNTLLRQLPGREEVAINSACSFEGDVRYYNRTVPPPGRSSGRSSTRSVERTRSTRSRTR